MHIDEELANHLIAVPYLDVGLQFDPLPILQEAERQIPRFVPHRTAVSVGDAWKSLALRSVGGDLARTESEQKYGDGQPQQYLSTLIWGECPFTTKLLSSLICLHTARRIRFMLLEPGGSIIPHKDSDALVSATINFILNAPTGSDFIIDINTDGSSGEFTRRIPLSPGRIFLINVARRHSLRNLSSVARVHLIVEGDLNLEHESLIQAAAAQNGLSRGELTRSAISRLSRS